MQIAFVDNVLNGDTLQNFHTNQYGSPVNSLIGGTNYYYEAAGSANAYTITVPAPIVITALAAGNFFHFKANFTNTGPATLKVNALTAIAMVRPDGTPLQAGDIPNGTVARAIYDGTSFQLSASATSPLYGSGKDGTTVISVNTTVTGDKQYNNLTINTGITLDFDGGILRVAGTLTINGTGSIRSRGRDGVNGNGTATGAAGGVGGTAGTLGGGGNGGKGGNSGAAGSRGVAGDTGAAGGAGGAGTSAGGTSALTNAKLVNWARALLGQSWLTPNLASLIKGGSGGGGGGSSATMGGPGAGGGGGVLLVCARHVAGAGTVRAPGGLGGAAGTSTGVGGGGGGGGGVAILITSDASSPFTLSAVGGTGGAGNGAGTAGATGGTGFTKLFTSAG